VAGRLALIAIAAFASVAGAGCSSTTTAAGHGQHLAKSAPVHLGAPVSPTGPLPDKARASHSGSPVSPREQGSANPAPWPERRLLRRGVAERIASQVIDPAMNSVYVLAATGNAPAGGPWMLRRIDLRTGSQRRGPSFRVSDITMAAGYLWIYGIPSASSSPVIWQIDPATMTRVRSIRLAPLPPRFPGPGPAITAGPADSVWIGSNRSLLRLDTGTGKQRARAILPSGLLVSDISGDPAGPVLYVSAARLAGGGMTGGVMLEYDARSGHRLAVRSGGLIRDSVAGAWLTAVPGGVWASFRTGMLGLTVHLSQNGLRMIRPPGPGIALRPANGIFHWPMYETTIYAGGALWLANQLGIVACLDPRTGRVLASERVSQSELVSDVAVDQARRTIIVDDGRAFATITPPGRCWG